MADTMPQPAFTRSPAQLGEILEKMEREGYNLKNLDKLDQRAIARMQVKGDTIGEEIRLLKKIDPKINGNASQLLEDLTLYRQENMAKRRFSAWEYVKSVPRRIWGTIKAHPKVSIAISLPPPPPPPPPAPSPLPTAIPSLDEAGKIIDALGRSG